MLEGSAREPSGEGVITIHNRRHSAGPEGLFGRGRGTSALLGQTAYLPSAR